MKTTIPNHTLYSTILKGIIIGFLLKALIGRVPYEYYEFMRVAIFVLFIAIAAFELSKKAYLGIILALSGAILFNPISRIILHKYEWLKVDKYLAIILFIWIVTDYLFYSRNNKGNLPG